MISGRYFVQFESYIYLTITKFSNVKFIYLFVILIFVISSPSAGQREARVFVFGARDSS
jgi:hypothetical protein